MNTTGFEIIENEKKKECLWMPVLLTGMSLLGILFTLSVGVQTKEMWLFLMISYVYVSVVLLLCAKWQKYFPIVYVAAYSVAIVTVLRNAFYVGLLQVANGMIALYNYHNGTEVYYYGVPQKSNLEMGYVVFVIYLLSVSGLWLFLALQERKMVSFVLCNFLNLVLVIVLKSNMGIYVAIFSFMAIVGVILWKGADFSTNRKVTKLAVAGLFGGVIISAVVLHTMEYKENEALIAAKSKMIERAEQQVYGKTEIPEGDLSKAAQSHGNDEVKFVVTASEPGVYYLKGYVGGNYQAGVWKDIDRESYGGQYQGLFSWLEEQGFHSFTQTNQYLTLAEGVNGKDVQLQIENKQDTGKYAYIPYGMSAADMNNVGKVNRDLSAERKRIESTQYQVLSCDIETAFSIDYKQSVNIDREDMVRFCKAQDEYQGFVNANYLQVDDEFSNFFEKELSVGEVEGYASVTTTIRHWLEDKTTVDKEAEVSDYLMYFLKKSKEGNSNFYASAATLIYRCFGIPARYVEGYRVDVQEDSSVVTGANVHAWVEVYKSGFGWIPVEVTPGYYEDLQMGKAALQQGQSYTKQQLEEQEQKMKQQKKRERKNQMIIVWLIAGIILLCAIVLCILRRWMVWLWRKIAFMQKNQERRLHALMRYIRQLLEFDQLQEMNLPEDVLDILEQYRFAGKSIKLQDCDRICECAKELKNRICDRSDFLRRMWMRYGRVLG